MDIEAYVPVRYRGKTVAVLLKSSHVFLINTLHWSCNMGGISAVSTITINKVTYNALKEAVTHRTHWDTHLERLGQDFASHSLGISLRFNPGGLNCRLVSFGR